MAKTLKVITHNKPTDDASSVDGALAKAISDAIGGNTATAIGVGEIDGSVVVVVSTS